MIIDEKIRDGKLQNDIKKEVEKIFALSPGKIDRHEYYKAKKYCLLIKIKW